MIGQLNLINQLYWMGQANCFPRFLILVGSKGSGKKTLSHYIHQHCFKKDVVFANMGTTVDSVRQIIANAYRVTIPTIYLLANADSMSVQAKNALLKVTEEPPNNAYFIMTLTDINNMLDTIRSRAMVFNMQPYTSKELAAYAEETYGVDMNKQMYIDICSNPGDINLLYRMGAEEFCEYVDKVIGNIGTVSGANSFKIADKVSLKEDAPGYDLYMFWKAFISICMGKEKHTQPLIQHYVYIQYATITSKALEQLAIRGINKQSLFDMWILDIREVYNRWMSQL